MQTILQCNAVSKSYLIGEQRIEVLRNVSCDFPAGKITALVGPSGSGKSTLLSLIAGLDTPDSGAIIFDGKDLARLTRNEMSEFRLRHLGIIFQFFNLLPTLTIRQNVALPAKLLRSSSPEETTTELLKRFDISKIQNQFPHQCSGGELQRAAIARALMNKPKLLLADEPTGNLDRKNGDSVLECLQALNRELGISIILVTHDDHTRAIASHTLHLFDGRIAKAAIDEGASEARQDERGERT